MQIADRSCAVAEGQKARYEHAQSLLVRGTIARRLGLPEADEQIRTAEAAIEAIERPLHAACSGAGIAIAAAANSQGGGPTGWA